MTATPPPTSGQIETPNPLELFWEKNKRWVTLVAVVALVAMAGNYVLAYFNQKKLDALWSGFATASHLDVGYAEDGSLAFFLENAQSQPNAMGMLGQYTSLYLNATRGELTTDVQSDLKGVTAAELAKETEAAKGTPAEPLLLWVGAVRGAHHEQWSEARRYLDDLATRFPDHFLCVESPYPPQFRPEIEKDEPEKEPGRKRRNRDKPELESPLAGSCVSLLRAQIDREEEFRRANAKLYQAPEPDENPEVVIRFSPLDEEIRIRFYRSAAPNHVDNFLALVQKGEFYGNQRIDRVHRAGRDSTGEAVRELHLGLLASKDDDRTKWDEARGKESGILLDFEDNDLSHFPGMVAADSDPQTAPDGKSSGERIWINANDAVNFDGQRVIFGRVVQGLEVLEQICDLAFVEEEMERTGQGTLQTNVTIESITILNDVPPPPVDEEK